jgi:hypothetical protein
MRKLNAGDCPSPCEFIISKVQNLERVLRATSNCWAESHGRIGIENHESRKKRHFEETLKAGGSWREAARRELR